MSTAVCTCEVGVCFAGSFLGIGWIDFKVPREVVQGAQDYEVQPDVLHQSLVSNSFYRDPCVHGRFVAGYQLWI